MSAPDHERTVSSIYHEGNRKLQDLFDTRRMADRLNEAIVRDFIAPSDREFIERMDMFFIATVDEDGHANCSYKGGEPGFVRVVDEHTIAFPNYDGNGMYLRMGNVRRPGRWGCCSSISITSTGCGSTARRPSTAMTR